jgi:hypothetical protein
VTIRVGTSSLGSELSHVRPDVEDGCRVNGVESGDNKAGSFDKHERAHAAPDAIWSGSGALGEDADLRPGAIAPRMPCPDLDSRAIEEVEKVEDFEMREVLETGQRGGRKLFDVEFDRRGLSVPTVIDRFAPRGTHPSNLSHLDRGNLGPPKHNLFEAGHRRIRPIRNREQRSLDKLGPAASGLVTLAAKCRCIRVLRDPPEVAVLELIGLIVELAVEADEEAENCR